MKRIGEKRKANEMELHENKNGNDRKLECQGKSAQKETEQIGSKIKRMK